jgi:pimeloyl-ACP methyl ester carboxylesterase
MKNAICRLSIAVGLASMAATIVGCAGLAGPSGMEGPLAIRSQGSYFAGGRDVKSDTLSAVPAVFSPIGTIAVDQMYVRYQIPEKVTNKALVFVHGCCLTGKSWESTPDGRMGWDEFFLRKGFPTYVVDQASRGRSASDPSVIVSVKQGKTAPDQLPPIFSSGREGAWEIFRFGPEYPKVFPGMQFPLEAQAEFWKQMTMDWSRALPAPNPTVPALSELAKKIRGAVLVVHSQSGLYPFQTAGISREGIAGIVSIEPAACPAPNGDMKPYANLPILILWGDFTEAAPVWAARVKACGEFVKAANAAGGKAEMVMLADVGMPGNSHMLMQDRTSLKVADWLAGWLDGHIGR